ncbi:cysteine--tRNA ligase [Pseudoroseicyclus tamaricis]|uniref:Cysteine--tRNA ligase n=1 Tax=Pseudoroseicyclus tamaricis TaxID=2705421 RepID=A0A6B2JHP3_9RHOB|nr:cysteine--tRNA ligase [Pseudoroseicyclus tamaricis]NDV00793.1 cysteine--tRNA ligase [Pseudoroseicyclus tamaricis]
MTTLHFWNSKSRAKEPFAPIREDDVRIYLCGPTVYDRAHLGNARPVVTFDLLFRLLRHVYGEGAVSYARNFTDVDDKINARAQERAEETGESVQEAIGAITEETIGWYHDDMEALGTLRPTHEPRATGHVGEMIAMIEGLIETGHAYEAEGHVLFSVGSYPEYGALSGRSVDDMIAGARVEVAPYKRDPMDFVLWKPSDESLPGWESPWGRGRPGWHIECSAMSDALFGPSFDIHGGGTDLTFPHHENELAQSMCAHPEGEFARVWLHNEMLQVEGRKMSKSLGNFFTIRDLLDKGVPGEVIRFVLLSTHYRKPMDWTETKREEAEGTLRDWRRLVAGAEPGAPDAQVLAALGDDLNTAGAIARLHELARAGEAGALLGSAQLMGLLTDELAGWEGAGDAGAKIEALLEERHAARKAKDFARADEIRALLTEAGVEVMDRPDGADWAPGPGFDAGKLV